MNQEELIEAIKKLESRKKYGLVWDEERTKEVFEVESQNALPVLKEVKGKEIKTDPEKPTNILIEGDNYHALSVLNFTHQGKIDVIYIDPPYNTGVKDWKYNNDYVDENDAYRHSKWLSMMYKRLLLAKRLVKENGVLIVTIDDHELFGLLGLLENLSVKTLGRVSICIKPEGRRQSKYIMEAHEYAIFVTWGNPEMRGIFTDFGLDFPETDTISKFRWEGLMRRDAGREDRGSAYWYQFYVSPEGEISTEKKGGFIEVWPINTKGIERVWLWDKERAANNLGDLRAVVRSGKATIYYKRREQGRVKPTSFWYGSKYNANAYGTRVVSSILPENNFDYPKSVYSVLDCIDLFLPEKGTVLDFFAGSGTTGHATMLLNENDKGKRTFILCTNNENNICSEVTYPRVTRVIKGYKNGGLSVDGLGGNLKYFKTAFVKKSVSKDELKIRLTQKCTEMLCLREGIFEEKETTSSFRIFEQSDRVMAVYYALDRGGLVALKKKLDMMEGEKILYCFTLDPLGLDDADFSDWHGVSLEPIPQKILDAYNQIYDY